MISASGEMRISRAFRRAVRGTFLAITTELSFGIFLKEGLDNEFVRGGSDSVEIDEHLLFVCELDPSLVGSSKEPIGSNVKIVCDKAEGRGVGDGFIEISGDGADGEIESP